MATSAEALCKYNASEFCKFTEAVLEMKFDEEPKYAALIALFEPILVGCVHKPICVDSAIKASQPLVILLCKLGVCALRLVRSDGKRCIFW